MHGPRSENGHAVEAHFESELTNSVEVAAGPLFLAVGFRVFDLFYELLDWLIQPRIQVLRRHSLLLAGQQPDVVIVVALRQSCRLRRQLTCHLQSKAPVLLLLQLPSHAQHALLLQIPEFPRLHQRLRIAAMRRRTAYMPRRGTRGRWAVRVLHDHR